MWVAISIAAEGYFGKSVKGFVNPVKKPKLEVAHLYDINQRAVLGKLEKKADKFVFEFKGKILATGKVTVPLSIKALKWSKRVEEKLKASGGEISELR